MNGVPPFKGCKTAAVVSSLLNLVDPIDFVFCVELEVVNVLVVDDALIAFVFVISVIVLVKDVLCTDILVVDIVAAVVIVDVVSAISQINIHE